MRRLPVLFLLLIACGGLVGGARGNADDVPVLDAVVGTNDTFVIALNGADGKLIKRLDPGTYKVVVHDRSTIHNFHLASNGDTTVNFRTDLDFVGDQEFTVTFKEGVLYVYACEPHWQTMFNSFNVTAAPEPTTTTTDQPKPKPPALKGTVTPSGKVRLGATSVQAGTWRIVVDDRSRTANLHLAGAGVNKRTGISFTGKAAWTVRLRAGSYRYGSDPGALGRTLRVRP